MNDPFSLTKFEERKAFSGIIPINPQGAITLDPDYAHAHAWRGCILGQVWSYNWVDDLDETFDEVVRELGIARDLDDNDADVHRILSAISVIQHAFVAATYGWLDDNRAAVHFTEIRHAGPDFTVEAFLDGMHYADDAYLQHLRDGLAKAEALAS